MQSQIAITLLGRIPIALEGLSRILTEHGFTIVGAGPDLESIEVRAEAESGAAHLLLIDGLVDVFGPGYVAKARQSFPSSRVVVLSDKFDLDAMIECFRQGSYAFIVKNISSLSLVASLRLVAMGEKVMPSSLVEALPERAVATVQANGSNQSFETAGLSMREVQILACLVAGHPNKVISRHLNISEATVKVHVKAILRKLGVQNRTQAAIWAMGENVAAAEKDGDDGDGAGNGDTGHS